MDGEVQPKFGLMVSLILMNVTAIVLFFFATPTRETAKTQPISSEPNNSENVQMVRADITEKVMAGDADNSVIHKDKNVIAVMTPEDAKVGEDFVPQKKMSEADMKDPQPLYCLAETQNVPGKVGMNVIEYKSNAPKKMSKLDESSDRQAEPPLAVALKNFFGETSSGVRIFFDGLKNGYTKKRIRESSNRIMKITTERASSVDAEPSSQAPKVNPAADVKVKQPSHVPFPTKISPEPTPSSVWGPSGAESASSQEIIPTEIVMDVLSRTQKRTNELIYVFSKKVIPAIERMNERVADAVRLEKNLDSYTSALIGAIDSVVCSNSDTSTDMKRKNSKPRRNVVRKLKHTKAFLSDLSLMRDSRIHDYVGSFSKGEHSSPTKRPVFKTLAARCWHTRNRRMKRKSKKHSRRLELIMPEDSEVRLEQSYQDHLSQKQEAREDVLEQVDDGETKGNLNVSYNPMIGGVGKEVLKLTETPQQLSIRIEEVLALTSVLDQSRDEGLRSDLEVQPFLSPLNINSDVSMSSGMVCRSFVIKPTELMNIRQYRNENDSKNVALDSEQTGSPESIASPSSELHEVSAEYGTQRSGTLGSDLSIVCDSRIQGYDSYIAQKESCSVAALSPEKGASQLLGSSETIATESKVMSQQPAKSNHISFSGKMKNTVELVNIFEQLNVRQKEIAMENVCLLVLRIFEAWAESQQSISSLGLSRISLNSDYSSSTGEGSSQPSRPYAAICSPIIDSVVEQRSVLDVVPKDSLGRVTPREITVDTDQSIAEVPQNLLQNFVAAAEIQIAERSLMGGFGHVLRNPPLKVDVLEGFNHPADTVNQSGFGDINERIIVDEEVAASLMSKSHESVKASKESSAATFYTSQPELSEETFYECVSTMSAGTCGSLELEVEDSSKVFLEKIQEEGIRVLQNESDAVAKPAVDEPLITCSSLSVQSWLSDSGEELRSAKNSTNVEDFPASDNSSCDVSGGTDDETYPCSSVDLSADESKADNKPKKKKWAAKFFKKFLKKKSKPSSLTSLSKKTSRSQSNSILKPSNQDGASSQ